MDRCTSYRAALRVMHGMALAVPLGLGAVSLAQGAAVKTVPDAQVEANVLKALAGASNLANEPITTTTVYGVVTLSGTVQNETLRTEAETIASRTSGVQKVVDELTLSSERANTSVQAGDSQASGGVLQSDGTMAPAPSAQPQTAPIEQGSPDSNNTQASVPASGPSYGPGAPEYRQPYGEAKTPGSGYPQQQAYPQQRYPQQRGYPQQRYPQQREQGYNVAPQTLYGGQAEGVAVTIPSGSLLRMRISQSLDSGRTQAGTRFDGVVVNDVVADGAVAIPRGAAIQGVVVDAQKSGVLKGRGELSLQLTQVTLAGKSYPLVSDIWTHNGGNKTTESVNKTMIGGGIGALIGAAAGGGTGAAIGAGVGGALGLGSSAASGDGQVYVPSEGMLTFHLAEPATVATVSQQEMDRLSQGVPVGAQPRLMRRRYYPAVGFGPVYYRTFPPYPYSPYPYPYPY